jgi:hypothetical protein
MARRGWGHAVNVLSQCSVVGVVFRAEGDDGGREPLRFGPWDDPGCTVAGPGAAQAWMVVTWVEVGGERASIPRSMVRSRAASALRAPVRWVHRAPGCQEDPKCFPEPFGPEAD